MNELKLAELLKRVKYKTLDNGFKIIYYSSDEYEKYYINYTTRYGATDYSYKKGDKLITHNPGVAHFLEHVMFNMPYGDAFEKFSKGLASANAYTSYDKTSYLFSGSQNIMENLQTLLDMVNTFYLTDEKVEKEKGIILEEIGMYDKNPDWQIYKQSLQNSIANSKYKEDILGMEQDVKDMTLEMLKEAYEDFYAPENQYITIVGPKVEELVKYTEEFMKDKIKKSTNIQKFDQENLDIRELKENNFYNMNISQQYLAVTYKEVKNDDYTKEDKIYLQILLEAIFTNFNDKYLEYEENKEFDSTFMYDFIIHKNMKLIMFYILNKDIDKFSNNIEKIITTGIEDEILQVIQKKCLGKMLGSFDEERTFAELLNNLELNNLSLEKYYKILKNLEKNKIDRQIKGKMTKIKTTVAKKCYNIEV